MKKLPVALSVGLILTSLAAFAGEPRDPVADRVIGQVDFLSGDVGPTTLNVPTDVAIAADGRLFLSDALNNRILSWPSAPDYATGDSPDLVIGQPDFTSSAENNGGVSASSLKTPFGLAVDAEERLYVADAGNNRVLIFENPAATDATADFVLGQPDFTSNADNNGGVSASSLSHPIGIAVDHSGTVYVADQINNRVLGFLSPLTTDIAADLVFGQPNVASSTANNGGLSEASLFGPHGVAVDSEGNVFIADSNNSRVLEYDTPATTDTVADVVLGQIGFTTTLSGTSRELIPYPEDIFVDGEDRLYVSDSNAHRVLQFVAISNLAPAEEVFGQADFTGFEANTPNGFVSASGLNHPLGLATDAVGNLYVADLLNHRVVVYDVPRAGTFAFETSAVTVGEAAGSVVLTIVREGGSDGEATVDFATADGTAIAGQDYTADSGTLVFADGETSKTLSIDLTEDDVDEASETFTVALSGAAGSTLGDPATATVAIQDGTVVESKGGSGGCSLIR